MNRSLSATLHRSRNSLPAVVAGIMLSSVCVAAEPPPTAALQAAETAIATADQAHAADHASMELNQARRDLNAARDAVREHKMTLALYLAEESKVGAQLASARSEMMAAQIVNDSMIKSIATLKTEMNRKSGAKQ